MRIEHEKNGDRRQGADSTTRDRRPRAWLRMVQPDGSTSLQRLRGEPFTIGRRSGHDLQIQDPSVSRNHARITYSDGRFWIEDLGSRHGTYVEGQAIHRVPLFHNATIRIGKAEDYRLIYQRQRELAESDSMTQRQALVTALKDAHNLRALLEATRSMALSPNVEQALSRFLDVLLHVSDAHTGAILLLDQPPGQDTVIRHDPTGAATISFQSPGERSPIVVEAILTARVTVFNSPASDESDAVVEEETDDAHEGERSQRSRQESTVAVPLRTAHHLTEIPTDDVEAPPTEKRITHLGEAGRSRVPDVIGVAHLEGLVTAPLPGTDLYAILDALGIQAANFVESSRLWGQEYERRTLERELTLARTIQQGLLRPQLPSIPWLELARLNLPAREVAGDYHEVVTMPDGTVVFAVGDVSGKGVPAALLMATLQATLLAALIEEPDLAKICSRLNRLLWERTPTQYYATLFVARARLEEEGGISLDYVNAGHNPPLRKDVSSVTDLGVGGLPLGLFESVSYRVQSTSLGPGEVLVCYTDGLTEATDPDGNEFGRDRLASVLADSRDESCQAILDETVRVVTEYRGRRADMSLPPFVDDLTLLIARGR